MKLKKIHRQVLALFTYLDHREYAKVEKQRASRKRYLRKVKAAKEKAAQGLPLKMPRRTVKAVPKYDGTFQVNSKLLCHILGSRAVKTKNDLIDAGYIKKVRNYSTSANRSISYSISVNICRRERGEGERREILEEGRILYEIGASFEMRLSEPEEQSLRSLLKDAGATDYSVTKKKGRTYSFLAGIKKEDRPEEWEYADIHAAYPTIIAAASKDNNLRQAIESRDLYKDLSLTKEDFFQMLFGQNAQAYNKSWPDFERRFPVAAKFLVLWKLRIGPSKLSTWLNAQENIIITTAMELCFKEGGCFARLHDCIVTYPETLTIAKESLDQALDIYYNRP